MTDKQDNCVSDPDGSYRLSDQLNHNAAFPTLKPAHLVLSLFGLQVNPVTRSLIVPSKYRLYHPLRHQAHRVLRSIRHTNLQGAELDQRSDVYSAYSMISSATLRGERKVPRSESIITSALSVWDASSRSLYIQSLLVHVRKTGYATATRHMRHYLSVCSTECFNYWEGQSHFAAFVLCVRSLVLGNLGVLKSLVVLTNRQHSITKH